MSRKWRKIHRSWQGAIPWRPFWLLFLLSFLLTFSIRYFTEGAAREHAQPRIRLNLLEVAAGLFTFYPQTPKEVLASQLGFLEGGRILPTTKLKTPSPKPAAPSSQPIVAIYHTHTGESYVPSCGKERLQGEGEIVEVGAALAKGLEAHGIGVLHVRKVHDHEPWHLSYTRSRATVRQLQEQYPSLQVFIDVHRDGIADAKTPREVTTTTVGAEKVARIMLYVGSERGGKPFPNRDKVLAFNKKVQASMERLYPGLARPLFTKGSFPHNGDLADKFLLVEVGDARLNSKEEAVRSAGLLADALAMLLYEESWE